MSDQVANADPGARAQDNLEQLNGLRGIAALVVIISHCANAGFLPSILGRGFGQMGVCLFFILSGFLMGYLYLGRPFTPERLREYVVKRAARVLPLFFFCLCLAVLAYAIHGKGLYEIQNLRVFLENAAILHGTGVLWSIPVEVHFYIVFAVIWFVYARGVRIVPLLGAVTILQLGAIALFLMVFASTNYLPFWLHIFAIGVLASVVYRRNQGRVRNLAKSRVLVLTGWGVAVGVVLCLPELRRAVGLTAQNTFADPISIGYPALVFAFTLMNIGPFRFLAAGPAQWLGKVSFSLYLLHVPVIQVTRLSGLADAWPVLGFVAVVVGSCGVAAVTFTMIEAPAQNWIKGKLLAGHLVSKQAS